MSEITHGNTRLRHLHNWPNYWAGDDGIIYSTKLGFPKPLKPQLNKKLRIYYVTLYSPDILYLRKSTNWWRKRPTPQPVHVLIAAVWLRPSPQPQENWTINHEGKRPVKSILA
jgi:hypothetical protein